MSASESGGIVESDIDAMAAWIAQCFHQHYEGLAPAFSYQTRKASAVPWDEVPEANRQLMTATVRRLLERGIIDPGPRSHTGRGQK